MALAKLYNGSLTAGTKLPSSTTGFVVPDNYAGVLAVAKTGAGSEYLEWTFPRSGSHKFAQETTPHLGEIAVETRLNELVPVHCGWQLAPGTPIDVTPRGAEAGTEGNIIVWFGRAEELGQAIHWTHAAITTGTTAKNTTLVEEPGCSAILYALAHGANQEYLAFMRRFDGELEYLISNHQAENAGEIQIPLQYVGQPLHPDGKIYYGAVTTGHGAGAAGHMYFGLAY